MTKTIHPHVAFIAEALQDLSREIECRKIGTQFWAYASICNVVKAAPDYEFRFKDTVKPKIVSTLKGSEIHNIWQHSVSPDVAEKLTAIANAACAAERERICALPAVTSLTYNECCNTYHKEGLGYKDIADLAIQRFLDDLAADKCR